MSKCPVCDGFGGWYDGIGPNTEPVTCEVCKGTGEVSDESQTFGTDCPDGRCEV